MFIGRLGGISCFIPKTVADKQILLPLIRTAVKKIIRRPAFIAFACNLKSFKNTSFSLNR